MAIETDADLAATTYADVAAADARALIRRGAVFAAWDALSDDDKLAALTSETQDLDTLDWIGERASESQALEWPRTGTEYSADKWPTRLVDATIEAAFASVMSGAFAAGSTTDALARDRGDSNIKREKIGPLETEYFAPPTTTEDLSGLGRFPLIVQNLLRPLVRVMSTSPWGSGTVVRGS